jgi:NDP-sugar pyrophosphorylase family protein
MSKVQRVAVCGRLVVLAAGRASRMRRSAEEARRQGGGGEEAWWEEAAQRPKPMIRVGPGGEPVLQVLLERAERAGFTSVTVVVAAGDALTPGFCAEWNETAAGPRMRVQMAVQPEPRGTGHAVQCALEQDPVPPGEAFGV